MSRFAPRALSRRGGPIDESARAALRARPWRFRFDAAVRIFAARRDPADALRFRTPPGLAFPPADVPGVDEPAQALPRLTVAVMGLTGPSGVMPRFYTEALTQALRARSRALHDFADLLGHRFVAFFARAGAKYRPARAAEATPASDQNPVSQAVLALTGYGTPHLSPRMAAGIAPLLHYAGLFAMRPRAADRLAALVSDWLGMRVEVVEFAGAWLTLPPDQRTRLPAAARQGAFCRLGADAAIGLRAWDPQARFVLRIGPLGQHGFAALLPDRTALQRLVALVRAYVGFEQGFAVNPVLGAAEVPALRLDAGANPPPRLGWNCWLPVGVVGDGGRDGGRRNEAADAVFEAEVVEAQQRGAAR